jgi:CRP-like cAMP-binding protein
MPLPIAAEALEINKFLSVLPRKEFEDVKNALKHVELEAGDLLWEEGEKTRYLYFPTTSLISLVYDSDSGSSVAIATLGRSGIAGSNMVLGNIRTPDRAVVTYKGSAFRMEAGSVAKELSECGEFQSMLIAFTQVLITLISQNAICNRLHRIDQQLARWLLDCNEELGNELIEMTHDQIASVLGVRRESVSLAAAELQKRKAINGGRGKIKILNFPALRDISCECYSVVRKQLDHCLNSYTKKAQS